MFSLLQVRTVIVRLIAVILLSCLTIKLPVPASSRADECVPWHWHVYHTCETPGVWCTLHLSPMADAEATDDAYKILGAYRLESEALSATCGTMGKPFDVGGPTAVYPGVKAEIGGETYDVREFIVRTEGGGFACRAPQPDSDSDGVPDYYPGSQTPKDSCPGTPGGVPVGAFGCPCVPKVESCEDICVERLGEAGTGKGTPPDCICTCRPPYDPEPLDDTCVRPIDKERCGNGTCDTEFADGDKIGVAEDCGWCRKDCPCPAGTGCSVTHPDADERGCVKVVAHLVAAGCIGENNTPAVVVHRNGTLAKEDSLIVQRTPMFKGDTVTLFRRSVQTGKFCRKPFLTIQWADYMGTVYLEDAVDHTMTITEDAADSGWPTWKEGAEGVGRVGLIFGLKQAANLLGRTAGKVLGAGIHMAIGPSRLGRDAVKVSARSHLVISQSPSEIVVHTLEGEATVEDAVRSVTVPAGTKATVADGSVSDPVAFSLDEIEETYRIDPLTLVEEYGLEEPAEGVGESGFVIEFGTLGTALLAGTCGLAAIGLIGGSAILWQRSRHRRRLAGPPTTPGQVPRSGPPTQPAWGRLSVTRPPAGPHCVDLVDPVLTIGRSSLNDLVLPDSRISRRHAEIQRRTGGAVLADLGSTHGTYVDGRRVRGVHPLRPGDVIRLGGTELVFGPGGQRHRQHRPGSPARASSPVSLVLDRPQLIIGRSSSCDMVIEDAGVSRRHAELRWEEGRAVLRDMGSSNGTYVDGRRIRGRCPLEPGAIIRLGGTELVYRPGSRS